MSTSRIYLLFVGFAWLLFSGCGPIEVRPTDKKVYTAVTTVRAGQAGQAPAALPSVSATAQQAKQETPTSTFAVTASSLARPGDNTGVLATSPAQSQLFSNLDDQADAWLPYLEGEPRYEIGKVQDPSRKSPALRVAITGGRPYSNVHAYYTLPPIPKARAFQLDLLWYFNETTYNNIGGASRIQAVELTFSKWDHGQRYEWALQWENVGAGGVQQGTPPTWRLWNGHDWQDTGIQQQLTPLKWHSFHLTGEVTPDGQVRYAQFVSDDIVTPLGQVFPPVPTQSPDRLTVAFQLDGNSAEEPYEVFFDEVNFRWSASRLMP